MQTARFGSIPVKLLLALLAIDIIVMICYKSAELQVSARGELYYILLLKQPLLWIGLGFSLLQLWTWTRILAQANLSVAYPISSLNYPLAMITAQVVFSEHLGLLVWIGGILVTIGVAVIAGGASHNKSHAYIPSPQQQCES